MTTGSALPTLPQIRSTRAVDFVASLVRFRYSLPGCSPPCTDQTGILPQPPGTFTSRLSTDRSSSPLLDITTTATGLLCWRDSRPLEWQLASLHDHSRPTEPILSAAPCPLLSESGPDVRFRSYCDRSEPGGSTPAQRNATRGGVNGAAAQHLYLGCADHPTPPPSLPPIKAGVARRRPSPRTREHPSSGGG